MARVSVTHSTHCPTGTTPNELMSLACLNLREVFHFLLLGLLPLPAYAQIGPPPTVADQLGIIPYQSYHGGDIDNVNLSRGLAHLCFSVCTKTTLGCPIFRAFCERWAPRTMGVGTWLTAPQLSRRLPAAVVANAQEVEVGGAHASKTAKRGAAPFATVQAKIKGGPASSYPQPPPGRRETPRHEASDSGLLRPDLAAKSPTRGASGAIPAVLVRMRPWKDRCFTLT
jgi:hypothetical protein